jgi:MinD superfamily P-loop ATPase
LSKSPKSPFPAIAVASGKGGTGKTTVAVHLAAFLAEAGRPSQYLDCDVEEPNGHLFLKPTLESSRDAGIPVPVVDLDRCTACGRCAEVCAFNAIAMLKKPMVFPELCHGCGACVLACPARAIHEQMRTIGAVETGRAGPVAFAQGRLNVGEPMAPPLIRALKEERLAGAVAIFDSPPGTSCPAVAAVRGCDFVVLVSEPTPFGIHDLALAVATLRPMGICLGVVANRADGDPALLDYCRDNHLAVLAELPDDRRVAETYARGDLLFDRLPEWRGLFATLWTRIEERL